MGDPRVARGEANLDDILFNLAVNFLLYVVLIIVFYMLVRFYLEEETSHAPQSLNEKNGYSLLNSDEVDDSTETITPNEIPDEEMEIVDEPSKIIKLESKRIEIRPLHRSKSSFLNINFRDEHEGTKEQVMMKLIYCGVGLNICYGIWGILQERILTQSYDGDFFEYSYGLVFINRFFGLLLSIFLMYYMQIPWVTSPLWEYSIPSVANMLSSWCQYEALKYVSFPTQMLAKAFKMLPIMLMGYFIHSKSYETYEYVSAIAVGFGLYLFLDSTEHIDFKQNVFGDRESIKGAWCGVVLLILFLFFDSFTGQWQKRLFQIYTEMSAVQMMLIIDAFSALFSFITLVHQEDLENSLTFVYNHPEMYLHLILFSIFSTVGQVLIYYTVKSFGAVNFSIIMAVRILTSTLLSCAVYSHSFTELGFLGFVIVFGAIGYRIHQQVQGKQLFNVKEIDNAQNVIYEWHEHVDV